jgi:hypothetical protein
MTKPTTLIQSVCAALLLLGSAAADDDYHQFSVCADSAILVEELSIVCDSPGSYYYGSSKYRNSATCVAGDKAKLQVVFEILEDLTNYSPAISVQVQAYGSVETVQLHSSEDLCSLSIKSLDGATCPEAGVYQVNEQFYWGSQNDEYEYNFKPVATIGFASATQNYQYYDLGGANTDKCKGGTFQNWSPNVGNSAKDTIVFFMITLGLLLGVTSLVVACRWYTMRSVESKPKKEAMEEELLDEEDVQRIAMMGREKDLIDA